MTNHQINLIVELIYTMISAHETDVVGEKTQLDGLAQKIKEKLYKTADDKKHE